MELSKLEATIGLESFVREPLKPFGLKITAQGGESVTTLGPALLDRLVRRERLVVLRGFKPLPRESFLEFCRSYPGRSLLAWSFGPVMEMKEQPDPANYLFSRERVPFHWDGAFHKVPAYLMFNCVDAPLPGAGGQTLFCNTELVWRQATEAQRAFWSRLELQYETAKLAHYGGRINGPLVQTHPGSGKTILRFAEPVTTQLNPVTLRIEGTAKEEQQAFLDDMIKRIYSDDSCYKHSWLEGDLLIADNHALIHGRTAFERDCPRHLRRIQLI